MHVDSERTAPAPPPTQTSLPLAAPPPTAPPTPPVPSAHATRIAEKGSFTTAHCTCGWFAPARRSRDKARKDARQHTAEAAAG